MKPSTPPQALQQHAGVSIIAGPWPSYAAFADLPEQKRWVMYGGAKAHREMLEQAGFVMSEAYDDFVRRVTRELNV